MIALEVLGAAVGGVTLEAHNRDSEPRLGSRKSSWKKRHLG